MSDSQWHIRQISPLLCDAWLLLEPYLVWVSIPVEFHSAFSMSEDVLPLDIDIFAVYSLAGADHDDVLQLQGFLRTYLIDE